jgi:hypothetical protein
MALTAIRAHLGGVRAKRDLVLLDENPLADIASIRRIRSVIVAGRLLDRAALDKVLAEVKRAARQ